jgi:hypothetical protein
MAEWTGVRGSWGEVEAQLRQQQEDRAAAEAYQYNAQAVVNQQKWVADNGGIIPAGSSNIGSVAPIFLAQQEQQRIIDQRGGITEADRAANAIFVGSTIGERSNQTAISSEYSPVAAASNIQTVMQPNGTYLQNPAYTPAYNPNTAPAMQFTGYQSQLPTGYTYDSALGQVRAPDKTIVNDYSSFYKVPSYVASNPSLMNPDYQGVIKNSSEQRSFGDISPATGMVWNGTGWTQAKNINVVTNTGLSTTLDKVYEPRGAAYEMAVEAERKGERLDFDVMKKAMAQGFAFNANNVASMYSGINNRSVVPSYNQTPGGEMVTDKSGRTQFVPYIGNTNTAITPGMNIYVPLSDQSQQLRENAKLRYNEFGAYDLSSVVPSTDPNFTRIYPMIVAGGGTGALQSGMVSGKNQTPLVYDAYGLNPLFDSSDPTIMDMLKNPQNYSRLGSEVYGGKVQKLDGRTLQGEFLKGNTVMPGRYAQDSMNFSNLVDFNASNTPKQNMGNSELPLYAQSSFDTTPLYQKMDTKTGLLNPVFPDWTPVVSRVVPYEQPEFTLQRNPDTTRTVVGPQFRGIDENGNQFDTRIVGNPRYASQFGGSLINNAAWNSTKELEGNAQYNAMIGGMKSDVQRQIDSDMQTWTDIGGYSLKKNPLYGTGPASATVESVLPAPFMSLGKGRVVETPVLKTPFTSVGKGETSTSLSENWWESIPVIGGFVPSGILKPTSEINEPIYKDIVSVIAPTLNTTTIDMGTVTVPRASINNAGADLTATFINPITNKPTQQMDFAIGSPFMQGGREYQNYQTVDLSKVTLANKQTTVTQGPSALGARYDTYLKQFQSVIPSSETGERAMQVASLTSPFGHIAIASMLSEKINPSATEGFRFLEPTRGQYTTFRENPVLSVSALAGGALLGGGLRVVEPLYGAIKTGAGTGRVATYSGLFIEGLAPKLFGGVYAADIGLRSTEYGKDISLGAGAKAKGIVLQEAVPMGIGMIGGYRAPDVISNKIQMSDINYKSALQEGTATGKFDYYLKQPVQSVVESTVRPISKARLELPQFYEESAGSSTGGKIAGMISGYTKYKVGNAYRSNVDIPVKSFIQEIGQPSPAVSGGSELSTIQLPRSYSVPEVSRVVSNKMVGGKLTSGLRQEPSFLKSGGDVVETPVSKSSAIGSRADYRNMPKGKETPYSKMQGQTQIQMSEQLPVVEGMTRGIQIPNTGSPSLMLPQMRGNGLVSLLEPELEFVVSKQRLQQKLSASPILMGEQLQNFGIKNIQEVAQERRMGFKTGMLSDLRKLDVQSQKSKVESEIASLKQVGTDPLSIMDTKLSLLSSPMSISGLVSSPMSTTSLISTPIVTPMVTPIIVPSIGLAPPTEINKPVQRPKPPTVPLLGGIPGFGGGSGSTPGGVRGRIHRETFAYNLDVGGASRATSRLIKRGSNIGTGSTSLGKTTMFGGDYKSILKINMPSVGKPSTQKSTTPTKQKKASNGFSLPTIGNLKAITLPSSLPNKKSKKK